MSTQERSPVVTGVLIALWVIGILLSLWFLRGIGPIVAIILVSAVLATGISPLVDRIKDAKLPPRGWHIPTGLAIILVFLAIILVFGGIGILVGTVLVREALELAENAPDYYDSAQKAFIDLQQKYSFLPDLEAISGRLRDQIGTVSSYAYRAASSVVGFVSNLVVVVTIFILTYYMLISREAIREGFLRLIPPRNRTQYGRTFSEMGTRMGGWLRGQLLLALIVGTLITLFLWILGVPYALMIGLLGALAEIIPMVGPAVAAIPAILFVLFDARWRLILIVIFFIILQQADSNYLTPKIMKQQAGLNPLVTILSLLVGASVGGVVGALLAIPLTAAVQVFLQRIVIPAVERAESDKK